MKLETNLVNTSLKNGVSIIIRTINENRLFLLKEAIRSVINNDYRPIEIIIVVQSQNNIFITQVKQLCDETQSIGLTCKTIVNYTSQDQRAKNLNLGLEVASGRYIGFLDDDDIVYPNHLSVLTKVIKNSNQAWAYTDCLVSINKIDDANKLLEISSKPIFKKNNFNIDEFLKGNFIPIHSYLVDTNKITKDKLKFNELLTVYEDYAFLIELTSKFYPLYISAITCEYRMFTNASNTNFYINQYLGINYFQKYKTWSKVELEIEKLKKKFFPQYKIQRHFLRTMKAYLSRFAFIRFIKQRLSQYFSKN
jgi:glycosyltransferase involved in cell wall biosynthesis